MAGLAAGVALALGQTASGAGVALRAQADRARVHVGEPVRYTLILERPQSVEVAWPQLGVVWGPFTVEQTGERPPVRRGEMVTETRWYRLVSDTAGAHTIPAPAATYRDAAGQAHEARGEPVVVTVESLLPADWRAADIREAKPLIRTLPLGWLALAAGLLAVVVGVLAWRGRRAGLFASPSPPPRSAHLIALEELERLRGERLPQQGAYDAYYVRLTAIARAYLERRYALRAPEMTTEEFLRAAAEGERLSAEHRCLLQAFLLHSDLVKFARYQPSGQEAEEAFTAARRFIEETIPVAAAPAAGPGPRAHAVS